MRQIISSCYFYSTLAHYLSHTTVFYMNIKRPEYHVYSYYNVTLANNLGFGQHLNTGVCVNFFFSATGSLSPDHGLQGKKLCIISSE